MRGLPVRTRLLDGEVTHQVIRRGAVPVFLAGCDQHRVARDNRARRLTPFLDPADALEHMQDLPEADHVVNVLPVRPAIIRYFGAERFRLMKRGKRFYKIGRGPTVDQPALIAALTTGQLDAAFLDVTHPEPLPPEHPLWSARNCFICPHTGGGHREESVRLVRHFLANLAAFGAGEELVDRAM